MGIVKAFDIAFKDMQRKNWDKIYVFVDLHSTAIKPNYKAGEIPTEFYENAKECLQMMSKQKEICLIMYTCSHQHEIKEYLTYFESNNIKFEYVNKNPEVTSNEGGYGYYEDKPYINVLLDDKAGFDAESDWLGVVEFLNNKYAKTTN